MLQAVRRDRCRNTAEFFFEAAESQDQPPPFVGNFGATSMRTAGAGDERRARQQIIDRVDSIPGGLVAKPGYFRRLGDALVLHHGFEQGDALASDKKPPAGAPSHKLSISPSKLRATRSSENPPDGRNCRAGLQYNSTFRRYRSAFMHDPAARAGAN
jgi:hypothetical protein